MEESLQLFEDMKNAKFEEGEVSGSQCAVEIVTQRAQK